MAEYRSLRERYSLLDICRTPDLATEVTLQPVRRLDVDAAILFSDLLLPLEPLGVRFDFIHGEGPAIENPLRTEADLDAIKRFEPRESLSYVLEAIRQITAALGGRVPLIGFAGAPFTLASYAIEGGHSTSFAHTKALMYGHPAAWHRFCDTLAEVVGDYLAAQVDAGVDAVQVFDSWVGALNSADYREFILPHTKKIFDRLACVENRRRRAGANHSFRRRHGIDPSRPAGCWRRCDRRRLAHTAGRGMGARRQRPWYSGEPRSDAVARPAGPHFRGGRPGARARGRTPGHIFNLGHGILPSTPVEHVQALARYCHNNESRSGSGSAFGLGFVHGARFR
jgi:uroporphyrinogen decarboxylase